MNGVCVCMSMCPCFWVSVCVDLLFSDSDLCPVAQAGFQLTMETKMTLNTLPLSLYLPDARITVMGYQS